MAQIPRDRLPDSTLLLALYGYEFISKRCKQYNTDIFQTRLVFNKTICLKGEAAARMFYETNHLKRSGAAPDLVKSTLFGRGGIQGLDSKTHHHRKGMFMNLMSRENIDQIKELTAREWYSYAKKWEKEDRIMLFPQLQELLCRVVCKWAEVQLAESEVAARTHDFARMIEGPGSIGPRHWQGRLARKRGNNWIGNLIQQVRKNILEASENSALHTVATHRDLDGKLLDLRTAAVELINILRPTIAAARFITFAAVTLHKYPEYKIKLRNGDRNYWKFFVHEIRRFYPFFPFVAARVGKEFEWNGYTFPKGARVLLDLYGTNHDRRSWQDPETFRPERFRDGDEDDEGYRLIPHGGGDYHYNHRCPGEGLTKDLIMVSLFFLLHKIRYDVPEQNMEIKLSRIPAVPRSRFIFTNVSRITEK